METTLKIIETLKEDLLSKLSEESKNYAKKLLEDTPSDRKTKQEVIQSSLYALEDGEYLRVLFDLKEEDPYSERQDMTTEEEEEQKKFSLIVEEIYDALRGLQDA